MKIRFCFLATIAIAFSACNVKTPAEIPLGTWKYKLFMNGVEMGTALTVCELKDGMYISSEELDITIGDTRNVSTQILTETIDFKPVSIAINNKVITSGGTQEINTSAVFNGKLATITAGGKSEVMVIDKPFVLAGNFFFKRLAEQEFRKGSKAEANIYDPSFETEDTIRVQMAAEGSELVTVNGKPRRLLHIRQIIEDYKDIDIYIDGIGIMRKAKILMLNNKIELEIIED